MGEVIYLEEEFANGDSIVISCDISKYESMKAGGLTDTQIFNEISLAHDTPTTQELIDQYLPPEKLQRFADNMVYANRRFNHAH